MYNRIIKIDNIEVLLSLTDFNRNGVEIRTVVKDSNNKLESIYEYAEFGSLLMATEYIANITLSTCKKWLKHIGAYNIKEDIINEEETEWLEEYIKINNIQPGWDSININPDGLSESDLSIFNSVFNTLTQLNKIHPIYLYDDIYNIQSNTSCITITKYISK